MFICFFLFLLLASFFQTFIYLFIYFCACVLQCIARRSSHINLSHSLTLLRPLIKCLDMKLLFRALDIHSDSSCQVDFHILFYFFCLQKKNYILTSIPNSIVYHTLAFITLYILYLKNKFKNFCVTESERETAQQQ
jgi:hypothetical protein